MTIGRIFILTDFGNRDYYVAAMKNVITEIASEVKFIIDITHEVDRWNITEGSFILWQFIKRVRDAILVGVVDPGVGGGRRDIVIRCKDNLYLIGPDNGLLYPAASFKGIEKTYLINIKDKRYFPTISPTFYGRDVYARTAGYIAKGKTEFLIEIDPTQIVELDLFKTKESEDGLEGRILHIDRFGNLITNIHCGLLDKHSELWIKYKEKIFPLKRVETFSQLKRGELGIICGSSEVYEIVANLEKASDITNFKIGESILIITKK